MRYHNVPRPEQQARAVSFCGCPLSDHRDFAAKYEAEIAKANAAVSGRAKTAAKAE